MPNLEQRREFFRLSTKLLYEELTPEETVELSQSIKSILNDLEREAGQEVHGGKVNEILSDIFNNSIRPE